MGQMIKIKGKKINYYPVELKNDGSEPRLDVLVAVENLNILKQVMDNAGIRVMLMYGTLLGAVRENGFIKHDSDTDVVIYPDDEKKLISMIPELEKLGLLLVRYVKICPLGLGEITYSFMRKGMWIDVYILQYALTGCVIAGLKYPYKYFRNPIKLNFYGNDFYAPSNVEDFLSFAYGKYWRVPVQNSHTTPVKYIFQWRMYFFIRRMIASVLQKVLPVKHFAYIRSKFRKQG